MEREEWVWYSDKYSNPDFPPPGWSRVDWEAFLDSEDEEEEEESPN